MFVFFLSILTSNLSIQVNSQVEKGEAELQVKTTKFEIVKVLIWNNSRVLNVKP